MGTAAFGCPAERRPVSGQTNNMTDLNSTLSGVLAGRFYSNLTRVRELAAPLTQKQFWTKPYPYGNSFGHLVLHLTGNLNYYIGAQIAKPDTFATARASSTTQSAFQRRSIEGVGRDSCDGYGDGSCAIC